MVTFTPNILHPWILIPLCSLGYPIFLSTHQKWKFASFFNFNNNDKIFILGLHCSPPPNPSVQFSSVTQLCPTLWDPMDGSTPGFLVHHQLQFTQTHVHCVSDAIQPSHPLSSPSPPTFNLSQHRGLFQRVSSSHQVAKVLEFQLQYQSFQWIFRTDFL